MKVVNIIACCALVIAALVYAGATPEVFAPGLEGFVKSKGAPAWSQTNIDAQTFVVFTGMTANDQLQLTKADGVSIIINDAKQVKQKGKVAGDIPTLVVGTAIDALGGNEKTMIKLKGVNVGTVLASTLKMVQVNSLYGGVAGSGAKGLAVSTTLDVAPAIGGAARVFVGTPGNVTMIKGIKAKGKIEYVDALNSVAAKAGKTKLSAKVAPTGDVLVQAGQYSPKSKNVILTEM